MPNRLIKESICMSDSIAQLTWFEEVLFYRLIVSCDDFGRYDGRAAIIKNRLFPLKDNVTFKAVDSAINALARAGLVVPYVVDGKPYLYLPTWNEHQSIRAKKPKFPDPPEHLQASENICMQMQADDSTCEQMQANVPVIQSNPIQYESNTNAVYAPAAPRMQFKKPTLEEVQAYCQERGNSVDAQRWFDYYEANGWRVGRNPMKDWKATVRTWEKNGYDTPKAQKPRGRQMMTAAEFAQREVQPVDMDKLRSVIDKI